MARPDFSDLDESIGRPDVPGGYGDAEEQKNVKYRAADFPKPDLTQPSQFRVAVQHIANVHQFANPEELQAGREWYPKVHEAVSKGIKGMGLSHHQGAGLVAAISPGMDFDKVNIPAFNEIKKLKSRDWDVIRHSAAATPGGPKHHRTSEANDVLRGMSISRSPDSGLMKVHRLLQGEDPEDVLPRQTHPKTNSFASNIHDPEGSQHVTVDSRAHDIAHNEMWPWEYSGRGIQSADLPSSRRILKSGQPAKSFGKKTRYENFEDAYRTAAKGVGESAPALQAITWTTGKRIEHSFPTKHGGPRVKGVARVRQPYL